ncbi:TcdA/TcdB catalytic glycosyltransferase domain-containing protein [Escherichia albertii]|uniref:TcdA/TcdB catalytic glycosyltransferase domain-containing protein n=1 Tax=Escherichia albertii TaxID=208962 RepID=UPI0007433C5D|nr:TcdA/TcdB catalytic glycosyltransferase domain-containing protein [Escherichia albertii]
MKVESLRVNGKTNIIQDKKNIGVLSSLRKIKVSSTEDVIMVGKIIQNEIMKSYSDTKVDKFHKGGGNWKSALAHRFVLLISSIPYVNYLTVPRSIKKVSIDHAFVSRYHHKYIQEYYSADNKEKKTYSLPLSEKIYQNTDRKKIKRSVDDIVVDNEKNIQNKKYIYDLTEENIEQKIRAGSDHTCYISENTINSLKSKIKIYNELDNKNSREGVEVLMHQANHLSKIYKEIDFNDSGEIEKENISSLIKTIQNEYKSHKVKIDPNIHVIWVAGAPPSSITKYAKAYKLAYPDFVFNLWLDHDAMSAYSFNYKLKELAIENAKHEMLNSLTHSEVSDIKSGRVLDDKTYSKLSRLFEIHLFNSMLHIQDSIMNYAYAKGLLTFNDSDRIGFLKDILKYDDVQLKEFEKDIYQTKEKIKHIEQKLIDIFGKEKVSINDIKILSDMKKVNRKQQYQQELILRGNYAAATDQLRISILKQFGGIYSDYDVTPAYTKEVYKIITDHSDNYDFLEDVAYRRALSDEVLALISGEESSGLKKTLPSDVQNRLDMIISKIKGVYKIYSPIDTHVIRDSLILSKRYQWWGKEKGWNIRGNNNFMATHKGSRASDFIMMGQDEAYREIFGIREQLRTEKIKNQIYYSGDSQYSLQREREKMEATLFVLGVENDDKKKSQKEKLNDLEKTMKEYFKLLHVDSVSDTKDDIRGNVDFLQGYKDRNAADIVCNFQHSMEVKDIVLLMKKNKDKFNKKQLGALSYEVEKRALSITFQAKPERVHRLFSNIAYNDDADFFAKEKMMPQLFFLNLASNRYSGRGDPLSVLILTEKYLIHKKKNSNDGVSENLYYTASILSSPDRYSEKEVSKANQLLNTLIQLHVKNPIYSIDTPILKEKLERQSLTEIKELLLRSNISDEPLLLKIENNKNIMVLWSILEGSVRKYGFYEYKMGTVEFSSIRKISLYLDKFFGDDGLSYGKENHIKKTNGDYVFEYVISIDGESLSNYNTGFSDKKLYEILSDNIFDLPSEPITKKKEKVKFLPHKYSDKSLFSRYRMDGLVPRVYSTLHITGPDAIMRSLKNYYNSLGELGKCRMDHEDTRFKGLSKDSFVGDLVKISSLEGEHYDWINPQSVGVNDITPDDASTWTGKNIDIKEIVSTLSIDKTNHHQLSITPIKIDLRKLMIGWPTELKDKLQKEHPTFEHDYNEVINSEYIDLEHLSAVDKKIYNNLILSDNNLVKWVGMSLSSQLIEKINNIDIPVNNKIHYLLSDINKHPDQYRKSIFSFLYGDSSTKIIIWRDDFYSKNLLIRELFILGKREKLLTELMLTCNAEEREKLELYSSLKKKEQIGIITSHEQDTLQFVLMELSNNGEIKKKLTDIELKAHASPHKKRINIMGRDVRVIDINTINTLKHYDGIKPLWNKYIISEKKNLDMLLQTAKDRGLEKRIMVKYISHDLDNSLIKNIMRNDYYFDDLDSIVRYGILRQESGVMMQEAAMATPSTELVNIVSQYTLQNESDTKFILSKIYDYILGDQVLFGPGHEQELKIAFGHIIDNLELDSLNKYFSSIMNQSVSPLGIKFSCSDGILTSDIIVSGIKDHEHQYSNIILDRVNDYLLMLYDLKKDIKKITKEQIKITFSDRAFRFLLQDDTQLDDSLGQLKSIDDISLSELSRILSGKNSFTEIVTLVTASDFPSIIGFTLKDVALKKPSLFSITDSVFIDNKTFKEIGYTGGVNYISQRKIHDISTQARYRGLSWRNFYNKYAKLWQDTVKMFNGENIIFHPQMLLSPSEGRCMGLAELYLQVNDKEHYTILQKNLDLASALYQESESISLSERDKRTLEVVSNQIQYYQQHGNNYLVNSEYIDKIRFSDFESDSVVEYLVDNDVKKILVTTDYHGIIISKFDNDYRVTDPNFGHADFPDLSSALKFFEASISISPEVHRLYTGGSESIDIYFTKNENWKSITGYDALNLQHYYRKNTFEKIKEANINVLIKEKNFELVKLYEYGVTVNGVRIDEKNTKAELFDIKDLKIDVNILKKYIDTHHIDINEYDRLLVIMNELTSLDGQDIPKLNDILPEQYQNDIMLIRQQEQYKQVSKIFSDIYSDIVKGINGIGSEKLKLKSIIINTSDKATVSLENSTDNKKIILDVDISELTLNIRKGLDALSDGVNNMNIDAVMSIVSIIQYVRLSLGDNFISSIDHANLVSDVKTITEKIVGLSLNFMGKSQFGSISDFTLEGIASLKLNHLAIQVGGTTGKFLSKLSNLVRFPVFDTALNLWALGESFKTYSKAPDGSLEKLLAEVDIAFASTFTGITLSSFILPPVGLVSFPLMFLQQEIRQFESYIHQENIRREAWVKLESFFEKTSRHLINIDKEYGIIDISACHILGGITLNLSTNPPIFTGFPSYNDGKNVGNDPSLSDEDVRKISGYAIACVDNSDAYIPDIFGNKDKIQCSDLSSETTIVKGFANRNWPTKIPQIPDGKYNTVILGYSSQMIAHTEVIRMTWEDFKEVARTDLPFVSRRFKYTNIISGDEFINVILPKIDVERDDIDQLSAYRFNVEFGYKGGVLYTNGIGDFNLNGKPHTRNAISFKNLSSVNGSNLTVTVDLSNNAKQRVVTYSSNNSSSKNYTAMTLIQHNVNTVIGSDFGINTFIGNSHSNNFVVTSTNTSIYLMGGANIITIPEPNKKNFNLSIFLGSAEHLQYINLGCKFEDVYHVSYSSSHLNILLNKKSATDNRTINIYPSDNISMSNSVNTLKFTTDDGAEFMIDDTGELLLKKINMSSYFRHHTEYWLIKPWDLNSYDKRNILKRAAKVFDYQDYSIENDEKILTYKIKNEDVNITIDKNNPSYIYGNKGGVYRFLCVEQPNHQVFLYNDSTKPETIDLSIFSYQKKIKVTALCQGDKCTLKIYDTFRLFEILIKPRATGNGNLRNSLTRITISYKNHLYLKDIFLLSNNIVNEVLIYKS